MSTLLWRGRAFVVVVVSFAALSARAVEKGSEHKVTELFEANFDTHLKTVAKRKHFAFVMFHVDWCKVCQRTFPKFAAASDLVRAQNISLDFLHVDCTTDKSLCQRFEVKGYPTLKLFMNFSKGAEPVPYKGQRSEEQFLLFAERMTSPAVRSFPNADALEAALAKETFAAFVAISGPGELHSDGGPSVPAGVRAAANTWRDRHLFAAAPRLRDILPAAVLDSADVDGASLVALSGRKQQWSGADNTSNAKPFAVFYTGAADDVEAVAAWVETWRFPGIWKLTEGNFYELSHTIRSTLVLVADPAAITPKQEQTVRDAANRYQDKYIFGVVDAIEWSQELADLNVRVADVPRILIIKPHFLSWVEDIDQLRIDSLLSDLRAYEEGAVQILEQDRAPISRLYFWGREAMRFKVKMEAFAARGQLEMLFVGLTCCAALALVCLIGKLAVNVVFALVYGEEEGLDARVKKIN